jgi:hypothetical protein
MTKVQKSLDSSEDSSYIDYMAAEIYGDASLLGRADLIYSNGQTTEQLDERERVDIFATPHDNLKNL